MTPRSPRERLAMAGLLAATVLTSLGHAVSAPGGDAAPPEVCVAGTREIAAVNAVQQGFAGAPLGPALVLALTCRGSVSGQRRAEAGVEVAWHVGSGGGTVNGLADTRSMTDTAGQARVLWSLGDTVGTQTVSATVDGRATAFTATAVPAQPGGSCTDLVASTGTHFDAQRRIEGRDRWTLAGSPYRGADVEVAALATLEIEPGVQVCLDTLFVNGGSLLARGTVQAPIRLSAVAATGLTLQIEGIDSVPASEMAHLMVDGLVSLRAGRTVLLEDSVFVGAAAAACRMASFAAGSTATTVRRTVFDGFGGDSSCPAAVLLYAAGSPSTFSARVLHSSGAAVRVHTLAGPWTLEQCELSGSTGAGLLADSNAATVRGCAITGNAGNGVQNPNAGAYTVNARGNWWGDAAGPSGPAGDGISAGVDAAQPLAAPPALGY